MKNAKLDRHPLDALFRPRHVAVVGASKNREKLGHSVLRNLINCGFRGTISPVNPSGGKILGLHCYRSVSEIKSAPDCAVVVLPHASALAAVKECAEAGAKAIVVPVTGFSETDTAQGRESQNELSQIAARFGIRILGPNTNGLYNATDRLSLGYNSSHAEILKPGPISVVSHSGAIFGAVARSLNKSGFGISKFVAVGNEADLNMLDVMEYFIADVSTRVIGLIIEAVGDGARLRELALRAKDAGKSVVGLKVGRSPIGIGATFAHSSRLGGGFRAYDALFQAAGIASVQTVEALAGACGLLATTKPGAETRDQRLLCVTTSGAGGALLVDGAAERNIPFAGTETGEWPENVARKLSALKTTGRIRNPVDLGVLGGKWPDVFPLVTDILESAGTTGPVAVYTHVNAVPAHDLALLDILVKRRDRTSSPVAVVAPGGLSDKVEAAYARHRMPLFHDLPTCLDSVSCLYGRTHHVPPNQKRALSEADRQSGWIGRLRTEPFLSELESSAVLRSHGVSIVESYEVADGDAAYDVACKLNTAVVLKALVPHISHKNKAGLVNVGLDRETVREAFRELKKRVQEWESSGQVKFIIQPMIKSKAELIIGVNRQDALGHFLVVGLGGIHAEIFDQVVLIAVPSSKEDIKWRVETSWLGRFISTIAENRYHTVMDEIVGSLWSLQELIVNFGEFIDSVDINPFLITDNKPVGVDALIVASNVR